MRPSHLLLAVLYFLVVLVTSCSKPDPLISYAENPPGAKLSKTEALAIALARPEAEGWNSPDCDPPKMHYYRPTKEWSVTIVCKPYAPGRFTTIVVHDVNGAVEIVPGV